MSDDGFYTGTCKACGQVLLVSPNDCWHPYNVEKACPPEIDMGQGIKVPAWGGYGRPGLNYFIRDEVWTDDPE